MGLKKKHRIAIYADHDSKASSAPLDREMQRSFPDAVIERIEKNDLRRESFYSDLSIFVLPGISGETSYYHDHVGPANERLRLFVASGGGVFAQCAGACYMASATYYTPEWAKPRQRLEGILGLFNGVAHGPVPGIGVNGEDPRYYKGLTSANVTLHAGDQSQTIPLVYSSGPTFLPAPGQQMDVLAHYADDPRKPPAIIRFDYGRGVVILSGPVPQYGAQPPTNIRQYQTLDALMMRLAPYEEARVRFFDSMMQHFSNHFRV